MEKILCFFVLAVCGASAVYLPDSRIVGGLAAGGLNEFRYAVSIQQLNHTDALVRGHICGGVLISLRHVLTTASCTYRYVMGSEPTLMVPDDYRVFAGSINLNDESSEFYRSISNVTTHPDYTGFPMFANDIAILTLATPFNGSFVTPLSLPQEAFQPLEGAECVTAGWGSPNSSTSASVSQLYARKLISNQKICAIQYNLIPGGPNIIPAMLCAASLNGRTAACNGDYGNGLVCNGGLAGILSMSTDCSPNSYPEVYTRVSNYTRWIRDVTSGASTFQPGLAALVLFTVVQLLSAKIIS